MTRACFFAAGAASLAMLASCGDDSGALPDAGHTDGEVPDGNVRGCPVHDTLLAMPGDPIDGDTWDTYAMGFFAMWCTRCHNSTLTTTVARHGAPLGRNWDDPVSVRDHLDVIREMVGELNAMPPEEPRPPCDERARIVRWIDAGAP